MKSETRLDSKPNFPDVYFTKRLYVSYMIPYCAISMLIVNHVNQDDINVTVRFARKGKIVI